MSKNVINLIFTSNYRTFAAMNRVFLHTGTNLGDRLANLEQANTLIEQHIGLITNISPIYETAAWGMEEQPAFLNQVVELESTLNPWEMMTTMLKIEEAMGRKREEKWGPRLIDLDLLAYGDNRITTGLLKLPHPELKNRKFVLIPFREIAPRWVHPVSGKSINDLLENTPDQLEVNILRTE